METTIIITDGAGNGRAKNPFDRNADLEDNERWKDFAGANPSFPVFQNGVRFFQAGEYQAVVKYQINLRTIDKIENHGFLNSSISYKDNWKDCSDEALAIFNSGLVKEVAGKLESRQIFEIVATQVMGDEKVKTNFGAKYKKGGVQEDAFFAILNGLSEAPDHWHLIQPFVDGAEFGAHWQSKRHSLATNIPVTNKADNSQAIDKQLVSRTEKTTTGTSVEELADKYIDQTFGNRFGHNIPDHAKLAFIAGHTAATEAFKEKVVEVITNYFHISLSDTHKLIELIKAL